MSFLRSLKNLRHNLFYWLITKRNHETITLGDECTWTINPAGIAACSIVYCAGVGGDISFEKQLVAKFDCDVLLLDPSPTGEATMSKPENLHPKLNYLKAGLADVDGEIALSAPKDATEKSSYFMSSAKKGISVPCLSLPTLMKKHGHTHIDLLKMDIEGFEYGVLRQICERSLPVRQICVEFHHSLVPGIARSQTISSIMALRRCGYRLIYRRDWDHTFVKS